MALFERKLKKQSSFIGKYVKKGAKKAGQAYKAATKRDKKDRK